MRADRPLRGALVGLGNIGFAFSSDRLRSGIWTHERALSASRRARLVAAADPSPEARRRFARARPDIPVFGDHRELLREVRPEFVAVAAPTRFHAAIVRDAVAAGARAVFDEKPIASTAREAAGLLAVCRLGAVVLGVNHTRRWDPVYRRAARIVSSGGIGEVRSVSARYSGHLYNVGTHLVDAVRMLTGRTPLRAWGASRVPQAEDPHVSGLLDLGGGVLCAVSCHGAREDLLFEHDLVGTEGRLRVLDNGARLSWERFRASPRFGGYREPSPVKEAVPKGPDRFLAAVDDLARCAREGGRPACSGADGYYALAVCEALARSARRSGAPVAVGRLPRALESV